MTWIGSVLDSLGSLINPATKENQVLCIIDTETATTTPLLADTTYTGPAVLVEDKNAFYITIHSDVNGAADGIEIQSSSNGTDWDHEHAYTYDTDSDSHYEDSLPSTYYRVLYTNGDTDQTEFDLNVKLLKTAATAHNHPISYVLDDQHSAAIVRAILTGKRADNVYGNVRLTNGDNLRVSVEELELAVREYLNLYPVGAGVNGSLTLTNSATAYAIPSAAPAGSYRINIYNNSNASIFVGYEDTNANGIEIFPSDVLEEDLGAGQQLYAYCASAGKTLIYSTKLIN